jgi:hypothetical protein
VAHALLVADLDVKLPAAGLELEIETEPISPMDRPMPQFGRSDREPKVLVEASVREMTLFVPEGERTLFTRLRSSGDAPIARATVVAEAGRRHAVEVVLPSR